MSVWDLNWGEGREGMCGMRWDGGRVVGPCVCVCSSWLGMAVRWWVSGSRGKLIADLQFRFHWDPTHPEPDAHPPTPTHIQPVNVWPLYSVYDIRCRCRLGYLLWMRHVLLGTLVMYELGFCGKQLWVLEAVPALASFSPPYPLTYTHTDSDSSTNSCYEP